MSVITMPTTITPREYTEQYMQLILDTLNVLDKHLTAHPESLSHIRWVANEGDPGCQGAAVVVAMMEKKVSKLKARIINNPTVR